MTDKNLKIAIERLYNWQYQAHSTSFTSLLYTMFQKADKDNRARLTIAFPDEAHALNLWNSAGDYGNDLFREFGLMK